MELVNNIINIDLEHIKRTDNLDQEILFEKVLQESRLQAIEANPND